MAHRRISFAIHFITFKSRNIFKEHMKRGAHPLAPGPAGVKGGFLRELMLWPDGTQRWEQWEHVSSHFEILTATFG
jgi:hypothetical protein